MKTVISVTLCIVAGIGLLLFWAFVGAEATALCRSSQMKTGENSSDTEVMTSSSKEEA